MGKTAIILWPTDKIDPHDVKEFIKSFRYKDVEKFILIAEDLGGVEVDEVKVKSYSSLLALLDNQEQAFKVPTIIVATTNHPEVFLGNITNRPGRFSDKIEVGYPDKEARIELCKFFLNEKASEDVLEEVAKKKYAEFSPAHIQEIALRADLYDLSIVDSMKQINDEIAQFKKMFTKKKEVGINGGPEYYD
jgi:SpoVK/Ycf46/Vps4 family AAA+-type ATPase